MEYIENCISFILNYKNFSDDITPPEKIKLDNTKNKINELTEKFNVNDVLIYGIGGHAGMCIDIIKNKIDFYYLIQMHLETFVEFFPK